MMTDQLMGLIYNRTSVRSFTTEEIPDESLKLIAKAARASATDSNKQLRKFTIVKNKELIKILGETIGRAIQIPKYDFYGAPAILLISVPKDHINGCYEVGLAAQNSWLVATALNLGMAWLHQINRVSDQPDVREVLDLLAIPSTHRCLNVLAIGVPAEHPQPKKHKEIIKLI